MPMLDPPDILRHAERLYDQAQVDFAIDQLAVPMALELQDARPVLVCVMNGGLPFAAALMRRFAFPLELDHVHARRYRGGEVASGGPGAMVPPCGGDLELRVDIAHDLAGRVVVLVDDVLDQGVTLAGIAAEMAQAGAARVYTAVLVDKKIPGRTLAADFAALNAPDRYLVGRGMDCGGWFRNLGGIYALAKEGESSR